MNRVIAEEAARWLCELREGGMESQEALLVWLKRSPTHVEEFLLASAIWKEMDQVGPRDAAGLEQIIAEARASVADAEVIRFGNPLRTSALPPTGSSRRRIFALAAAASVVVTVLGVWLFLARAPTYATAIGEQRIMRLPDGSVVQLNTHSRLTVNLTAEAREIRLLEGEALFTVAPDAVRPFRVRAGEAVVVALGTQFNVYRQPEGVTVSVVEGAVAIAGRSMEQSRLNAGEQARIESSGTVHKRPKPDLAQAVAWRERRLVFRGETLDEIAAQFNRYSTQQIRVEGAAARSLRLAGTFSSDDPESLILFLGRYPNLSIENSGQAFVIRDR